MDDLPPPPFAAIGLALGLMTLCIYGIITSKHSWTIWACLIMTVVAAVPVVFLGFMRHAGASPIAQLNGQGGMDWWGTWFDIWPVALFSLLGSGILMLVVIGTTAWRGIKGRLVGPAWMHAIALLATTVAVFSSFVLTILNFPDA